MLEFDVLTIRASPDVSFFSLVDGKWRDGKYVLSEGDPVPALGGRGVNQC